jgi:Ca2+-binding EF-hand superfamily protein
MSKKLLMTAIFSVALIATAAAGDEGKGDAKKKKGFGKGGDIGEMMFNRLDTNKDGKVSADEFKALGENGPKGKLKDNPEMRDRMFKRLDTDGDGFISKVEFKKMSEMMGKGAPGKKPGEKFKKPNGDGVKPE